MTAKVVRAGIVAASLVLGAAGRAHAQAPAPPQPPPSAAPATRPVTGFVSSYEIMKTVLSAGFHPLAQPLREGTTYVLRATDFRGILMRVVVDARTGTIRDVNRIVPGPGSYGQVGDAPPPYGMPPPDAMSSPYDPTDYDAPPAAPDRAIEAPLVASRPAASPPLPRPRPAAHPAEAAHAGASPGQALTASPGAVPGAAPDKTEVMTAVPPAAAAAPKKTGIAPLND